MQAAPQQQAAAGKAAEEAVALHPLNRAELCVVVQEGIKVKQVLQSQNRRISRMPVHNFSQSICMLLIAN